MRVVWNQEVLREEEKHRELHVDETCDCGTYFKGVAEERAARERTRCGKDKESQSLEGDDLDSVQDERENVGTGNVTGDEATPRGGVGGGYAQEAAPDSVGRSSTKT